MFFLREVGVAAVLVTLTLSLQSTAMAGFVLWARAYFAKNTSRLGLMRCADLMVRVTHVLLTLQLLEVALWAAFYRWKCFSVMGCCSLFFSNQLLDRRLWGSHTSRQLADVGSGRRCHGGSDVRAISKLFVCYGDAARSA
jgi:hypothetical protein